MSTMTSQQRQAVRFQHEGLVIHNAGNSGVENVIECTCAMIDGQVNGLLRIWDREQLFNFVQQIADRIAPGMRGGTILPEALKPFVEQSTVKQGDENGGNTI